MEKNFIRFIYVYIFLFLCSVLFLSLPAWAYLSSEYNADKHTPFGESVYEINPQSGSMGISARDLVLKGRAGHDLIIGRIYSNTMANAYNMGVKSGYPIKAATTHLDQKYGLGCGWGFSFPSIEINFDMQEIMGRPQYNLYLGNGGVYTLDFNPQNGICYYNLQDLKVTDQDTGYSRLQQGNTITSRYSLTMKDQSKYYFDRWGNLLAMYDPSHREANKIEFFYQGDISNQWCYFVTQ